jgi:hypothetical protein
MSENLPPKAESVAQAPENPSVSVDPAKPNAVKFLHEKTSDYRIVHVDGAWGSINSLGNAQLDLYVESALTPDAVLQPLGPDGNFSGEQVPLGRVDPKDILVVRHIQCGIVLSLSAATQIHSVLDSYIKTVKTQMDSAIEKIKKTP